jgi:hypothetical protein
LGGTYSTHGTDEKCIQILVGIVEGKRPFRRLGKDGRIILKWILKK